MIFGNPKFQCRNWIWGAVFAAFLSLLSVATWAQAMPSRVDWGVSTWTRAGTSVSWTEDLDIPQSNPALLSLLRGKSGTGGSWLKLPQDQDKWSVGVFDGRTPFVGAFHFDWVDFGRPTRHTYTISGSYPTKFLAFGVSAHFVYLDDLDQNNGWHWTQTIGVYAPLTPYFSLGVSSKSLLDQAKDEAIPPELLTGVTFQIPETFRAHFQADRRFQVADQDWNYQASGDLVLRRFFVVSGGYRWGHKPEESLWSVGGSIEAPKMSLGGFYTEMVEGSDRDGFGFRATFKF